MVVPRLFEKLTYSNERSTKFESLYQEEEYLEEENGKLDFSSSNISQNKEFVRTG